MRVFMAILCSLWAVCSVSAQSNRQEGTDRQAAIYRLQKGESYSARTMTKRQADALLRKDLRKFIGIFRNFGRDSVLLGTLAFNVGPAKLLGNGRYPKSRLIKKLEAGDRNIYHEYVAFCHYKGKRHAMLLKRRKAEFALLYVP